MSVSNALNHTACISISNALTHPVCISVYNTLNHPVCMSVSNALNRPVCMSVSNALNRPVCMSISNALNHPVCMSVSNTLNHPVCMSVSNTLNRPVCMSVSPSFLVPHNTDRRLCTLNRFNDVTAHDSILHSPLIGNSLPPFSPSPQFDNKAEDGSSSNHLLGDTVYLRLAFVCLTLNPTVYTFVSPSPSLRVTCSYLSHVNVRDTIYFTEHLCNTLSI